MFKRLVVIRHAEAEEGFGKRDFLRQLTPNGHRQVEALAKILQKESLQPDLVLCSTARRTRETAERLAPLLDYSSDGVDYKEELYNAHWTTIEQIIRTSAPPTVNTLFVIAHNPGVSEFSRVFLSDMLLLSHLPPSGAVGFRILINDWHELEVPAADVLFTYP